MPRAALATVLILMTATLAGCTSTCTLTTPAGAEGVLDHAVADIVRAFEESGWGWTIESRDAFHAQKETADGTLQVTAWTRGDGRAHLSVATPLEERTAEEAEALLAPHLEPVLARLPGATVSYTSSGEHCGAV
jgi:hypothetical protein